MSEFVKPFSDWRSWPLRGVPSLDPAADIELDTLDSAGCVAAWLRSGLEQGLCVPSLCMTISTIEEKHIYIYIYIYYILYTIYIYILYCIY